MLRSSLRRPIHAGIGAACVAGVIAAGSCGEQDGAATPRPIRPAAAGAASNAVPAVRLAPSFNRLTFRRPVYLGHAGDGTDRIFVIEQAGRILVFPNDPAVEQAAVFLDLREQVHDRHNEEGLLALAFHPRYRETGRFFVYYSADEPRRGVLSAFRVSADDPDRAEPGSEQVLLEVAQPWGNHNGCDLAFGPDGYLYVSLGDGGAAGDPLGSGQDLGTLLGTILRLDVDHPGPDRPYSIPVDNPFVDRAGARGEIWAYGLRNVWRMSFDRQTGELWAGDVGQNAWEEIDLIVKGGNYGWNLREGAHPFRTRRQDDGDQPPGPLIDPVVEYGRNLGISVTGGFVYRGQLEPTLQGLYFYADYGSGRIWALRHEDGAVTAHGQVHHGSPPMHVSSFGEDESGELYVCTFDRQDARGSRGRIHRIAAAGP
jgi:glucose/arabinose dehydrogenase